MMLKLVCLCVLSVMVRAQVLGPRTCIVSGSVIEKANHFAGRFLEKQGETLGETANFLLSPLTIIQFVANLRLGSRLETQREFSQSQLLNDLSTRDNQPYTNTLPITRDNSDTAIFFDNSVTLLGSYERDTNVSFPGTELIHKNFRTMTQQTREEINFWAQMNSVSSTTETLFRNGEIDSGMRMVAVNTYHLTLQLRFTSEMEYPHLFYTNETYTVEMREIEAEGYYVCGGCTQRRNRPDIFKFNAGSGLELIIFKATQYISLHDIEHDFCVYFENWLGLVGTTPANVRTPHFQRQFINDLEPLLGQHFGLNRAFQRGNAHYNGISSYTGLSLDRFVHQVSIDVDDGSTEEECTTAPINPTPPPPGSRLRTFIVDRPYAYIVRDVSSGAFVLAGRVEFP